jgi:hypothetical protein
MQKHWLLSKLTSSAAGRIVTLIFLLCPLLCSAQCPPGTYSWTFTNIFVINIDPTLTNQVPLTVCITNTETPDQWSSNYWASNSVVRTGTGFQGYSPDALWLQISSSTPLMVVKGELESEVVLQCHGLVAGTSYAIQWTPALTNSMSLLFNFYATNADQTLDFLMVANSAFFRLYGQTRPDNHIVEFTCGLFLAMILRKVLI